MKGLHFASERPIQPDALNRVDIACFIGFAKIRGANLPSSVSQWLKNQGWMSYNTAASSPYARVVDNQIYDVPVPIDSWDTFDELFAWESRSVGSSLNAVSYLGAAVNEFFAQGGRKCYVISMGETFDYNLAGIQRLQKLAQLLPGYPGQLTPGKYDRNSWHGIGHILGLPEISFLSFPDLADIFRVIESPLDLSVPELSAPPEQFVECSLDKLTAVTPTDLGLAAIRAPHLNEENLNAWRSTVRRISLFVAEHKRELQFVTSLPLPLENTYAHKDMLAFCFREGWLQTGLGEQNTTSLASAFLQISWPWLQTPLGKRLPQNIAPGEGTLLGVLARNALLRGAYRSIAGQATTNLIGTYPALSSAHLSANSRALKGPNNASTISSLDERFSLWKRTPKGVVLHSDVTTSTSPLYRNANVNRTFALILRSARHLGEEFIFESNGETLWRKIRDRLTSLLQLLFRLGALDGKSEQDAFSVLCDRSTMTRNDIDSGRVVARVSVNIATSIETMIVSFALQESSEARVSLLGISDGEAL